MARYNKIVPRDGESNKPVELYIPWELIVDNLDDKNPVFISKVVEIVNGKISNLAEKGHTHLLSQIIDTHGVKLDQILINDRQEVDTKIAGAKTFILGGASASGNTLKKLESLISSLKENTTGDIERLTLQVEDKAKKSHTHTFNDVLDGSKTLKVALNEMKAATTQEIQDAISNLVGGAPDAMNTLKELSDALQGNPDIINNIMSSLGTKANQTEISRLEGLISALQLKVNNLLKKAIVQ